ncbi:MAG TPA: hypothetical protein VGG74_21505 [Kofleriaceae bacterium]
MYRVICAVALATSCKPPEAPPTAEPPGLEMISAGVFPRLPIRYALAKGTKVTLSIDLDTKVAAADQTQASPPLHVTLDLAVDDVLPDGRMKLTSTVRSINASGDDANAAHETSVGSGVAGLAITSTLAPGGAIADVHATDQPLPDGARAELAQVLGKFQQLAMPLPAVPIGIGAKWRTTLPFGGTDQLALQAVTTVNVTGRTGSAFTYVLASELRGSDQTVVADGASVTTTSISGSASGGGTIDLARFSIDTTQSWELHAEMTTGSDRTPMTMTQTVRVSSH